jgi:hypothetical protein
VLPAGRSATLAPLGDLRNTSGEVPVPETVYTAPVAADVTAVFVDVLDEALIVRGAAEAVVALLLPLPLVVLPAAGAGVPMISMLAVAVGVTPADPPLEPPPQAASARGATRKIGSSRERDNLTNFSPYGLTKGARQQISGRRVGTVPAIIPCRPFSRYTGKTPAGSIGNARRRRPQAAKIALPTAGAMAVIGVSPAPADGRSGRFNSTTSIGGTSAKRGTR